jgi:prevent-host-death family protein
MDELISAAEANRKFSELLGHVRAGRSYVVTSHGKPVAKIIPVGRTGEATAGARAVLLARLRSEAVVDVGNWTRDELYEDVR